jgi:hypothetical protein
VDSANRRLGHLLVSHCVLKPRLLARTSIARPCSGRVAARSCLMRVHHRHLCNPSFAALVTSARSRRSASLPWGSSDLLIPTSSVRLEQPNLAEDLGASPSRSSAIFTAMRRSAALEIGLRRHGGLGAKATMARGVSRIGKPISRNKNKPGAPLTRRGSS